MKKFLALFMTFCMGMSSVAFAAAPSITKINAGAYKSYAVLSDGSLYTWGFGNPYDTGSVEVKKGQWSSTPVKTESGIAAAGDVTQGVQWKIKTDGSYWQDSEYWDAPKKYFSNAVAAEWNYVLLSDGTLWLYDYYDTKKVASNVKDFSVYTSSTFVVLKQDGSAWIWNPYYEDPFGFKAEKGVLTKFMDGVIDLEVGTANLYVVKKDGSLWGWGDNMYGQLGKGYASDYNEPNDKIGYRIMDNVASIETGVGGTSVFAIKKDGSLWAWGNGTHGVLGVGTKGSIKYNENFHFYNGKMPSPTKVMDDVAAVSSDLHTLILKKDGSLWACGNNTGYEIGDGAKLTLGRGPDYSQDRIEPVKISLPVSTRKYVEPSKFIDVRTGAYYCEPVDWAVDKNITSGTSSNTFSPDQTCTRGQIITFLWRAAGSPAPRGTASFADVNQNMYYAKAVAWAAEKGMADGVRFNPDAPCTREMAVEFMWKYAGSPDAAKASFADVSAEAVDWAVAEGITSGTSATTFSPDQTCTRGQIVTFLHRGFGK